MFTRWRPASRRGGNRRNARPFHRFGCRRQHLKVKFHPDRADMRRGGVEPGEGGHGGGSRQEPPVPGCAPASRLPPACRTGRSPSAHRDRATRTAHSLRAPAAQSRRFLRILRILGRTLGGEARCCRIVIPTGPTLASAEFVVHGNPGSSGRRRRRHHSRSVSRPAADMPLQVREPDSAAIGRIGAPAMPAARRSGDEFGPAPISTDRSGLSPVCRGGTSDDARSSDRRVR